jgi:hypothetical protein
MTIEVPQPPRGRRVVRRDGRQAAGPLDWLLGLDPALLVIARWYEGEPWVWRSCPDCIVPPNGRRLYCPEHGCSAARWAGGRCRHPGDPARGFAYCNGHGCAATLQYRPPAPGQPGLWVKCMMASESGSAYCALHRASADDAQLASW